ncbi:MAG: aminotransferase class I/II-fold pyridoxal phosphate-dependent enzyme [Rhodospirillales bacterium]|nr:aminotransferase class I/II-fold pyridoxal phosphate-dependent enzyme [Rhodospirillales bacterium]
MTSSLDLRSLNPFVRLNRLLHGIEPGRAPSADGKPLDLGIGNPRTGMPATGAEAIAAAVVGWNAYPPFEGHPRLLEVAAAWLTQLYALPDDFTTGQGRVLPTSGSREGIFFLTQAAATRKRHVSGPVKPLALLPDPGYHVYAGSALAADLEPRYISVNAAGRHLPDFAQLPECDLERTAIAFLCSPSNPQGTAAGRTQLAEALALARRHDFILVTDECYGDLYFGEAPPGGLSVAANEGGGSLANLVAAHSLSKRSGAPGLRCGFLTGDTAILDSTEGLLRFGGSSVPLPVQEAAIALLAEETHVEANRAFYRCNMGLAERHFGATFGWSAPDGGFFAWLDVGGVPVGDGETACRKLWQEAGIRTLPGAYMSLSGRPPEENPGRRYLRIALVDEAELLDRALARIAETLL